MKLEFKKNTAKNFIPIFGIILLMATFSSCDHKNSKSDLDTKYVSDLLNERKEKDSTMQYGFFSPFKRDTTAHFVPLKYFEPNPDFIFESKLYWDETPDTIKIMGTRGEARTVIVTGFVELNYDSKKYKVNIYKGFSKTGEAYYSIWFTDKTTGKETYGVGRYLDFELSNDPEFIYTIDFNKAYNPYCAYSPLYTCPIPREEDYIDIAIEAGEKNFH